jgi:EamA domain-containing membrane protein RarD
VVSIFFAIVIGWPLYWLAKKFSLVNYVTSALGGIAVTVIPLVLCLCLGWNIPNMTTRQGMNILFVLAFCGAVSGMVFNKLESKK